MAFIMKERQLNCSTVHYDMNSTYFEKSINYNFTCAFEIKYDNKHNNKLKNVIEFWHTRESQPLHVQQNQGYNEEIKINEKTKNDSQTTITLSLNLKDIL